MENEIWKDISDYPGYQISNFGRIKSLPRNVRRENRSGRITTYRVNEKILTATIGNAGYNVINLWKNNKHKQVLVHRLLAEAFIPKNGDRLYINHKDGNRANNDLSNLEWCTPSENFHHSLNVLGNPQPVGTSKGVNHYFSRKISAILPDGSIENFDCIIDAVNKFNLSSGNVTSVLKGRRKHTKGIKLKYRD